MTTLDEVVSISGKIYLGNELYWIGPSLGVLAVASEGILLLWYS